MGNVGGTMNSKTVLIVDDDAALRDTLEDILREEGYTPISVGSCAEALAIAPKHPPGAALVDIKLPDGSGTSLLAALKTVNPDWVLAVVTAYADLDSAVSALSQGAFQYLQKPVRPLELINLLDKMFETIRLRQEKREAEEKLRESEERFRAIFDTAEDAIYMKDDTLRYLLINPSAENRFGLSASEMIGRTDQDIFGARDVPDMREADTRVLCGEVVESEQIKTGEGNPLTFHEIRVPMRDRLGRPVGICGISRDITEKRKLETQLLRAQKMEAIGTVAGGIAHDFNNILGAIIGHTELARLDLLRGNTPLSHLDEVLRATQRATDLVRQILTFSRQDDRQAQPTDVSAVMEECLKLMRASLPATIEIVRHIAQDAGAVIIKSTEVHQVLMNLATNAAHAMAPKGGALTVTLENADLGPVMPSDFGNLRPGPYVMLTVHDTGCGMDERTRRQIFDPYFTTKPKDLGTGLGLAVVDGIVTRAGGAVAVVSQVGKGSAFKVALPRIATIMEEVEDQKRHFPEGHERILLVDDEAMLVDIGEQMLRKLGYEVIAKTSALDALESFRSAPDDIDLVITDMTMPHMTGDVLAREIMQLRPGLPVVICSGFSEPMNPDTAISMGIKALVMKPIVMRDLALTIRKVLDAIPT